METLSEELTPIALEINQPKNLQTKDNNWTFLDVPLIILEI